MLQSFRAAWAVAVAPGEWHLRLPGGLLHWPGKKWRVQVHRLGRPWRERIFGFSSGELMGDAGEPRIRLLISGRVQGVGYRAWVWRRALELGVRGWVRNCRDGSVEVEAAGSAAALARLRQLLEDGPPLAHVFSVREEAPRSDHLDEQFEIR